MIIGPQPLSMFFFSLLFFFSFWQCHELCPTICSCHGVMPHILNKGTRHLWTNNSKRGRQSTHYLFTMTLWDASNSDKMPNSTNMARMYPELMFSTVVNTIYRMKGKEALCPQEQCLLFSIYTVVYYELSLSPVVSSSVLWVFFG